MKVLRTPEERFQNLAGFPYEPNYLEVGDGDGGQLRIHYVDEGPIDGEVMLCLHGQPVWSYSFRKMIPPLTAAGFRVIAPDLVGFGRSDKPSQRSDYTFASHVHWMHGFVRGLSLTDITLIGQDWGGPIGLRVVVADTERFARIVVTNTGLPDARGMPDDMTPILKKLLADTPVLPPKELNEAMQTAGKAQARVRPPNTKPGGFQAQAKDAAEGVNPRPPFMYWIRFCDAYPDFDPGEIIAKWVNHCSAEEQRAYSAPFPSEEFKQGARQFPSLIPLFPGNVENLNNCKTWEVLRTFDKPFLTAFSASDPGSAAIQFQEEIPGAKNQNHVTLKDAGHFPPDDRGEELARVVIDFIKANPL